MEEAKDRQAWGDSVYLAALLDRVGWEGVIGRHTHTPHAPPPLVSLILRVFTV